MDGSLSTHKKKKTTWVVKAEERLIISFLKDTEMKGDFWQQQNPSKAFSCCVTRIAPSKARNWRIKIHTIATWQASSLLLAAILHGLVVVCSPYFRGHCARRPVSWKKMEQAQLKAQRCKNGYQVSILFPFNCSKSCRTWRSKEHAYYWTSLRHSPPPRSAFGIKR